MARHVAKVSSISISMVRERRVIYDYLIITEWAKDRHAYFGDIKGGRRRIGITILKGVIFRCEKYRKCNTVSTDHFCKQLSTFETVCS